MKPKAIKTEEQSLSKKKYKSPRKINPVHQEFMTTIGLEIEKLKKRSGISTSDLCKAIGISRYSYYLIERGQVYWNSQTLLNVLTFFKEDGKKFFRSLK